MSQEQKLSPEQVERFNSGLKMGQAVGSLSGSVVGLVLCAACPILPWAVGTVVLAQKGWEYGGKAGMSIMAYKGTKEMEFAAQEAE